MNSYCIARSNFRSKLIGNILIYGIYIYICDGIPAMPAIPYISIQATYTYIYICIVSRGSRGKD